jgi:copper(I)-binding protein
MRTFNIILVTMFLTACGGGMNHSAHMGMAVATPDLATTPVAQSNGIAIRDPWARQGTNGDNSAAYLVITNATSADTLLSATGDVATSVELHTVINENGMMQMIPAEGGVPVDANGIQSLKPGSFHIMLIGLRKDLKSGDSFPLTLTFANAGPINVMFEVR